MQASLAEGSHQAQAPADELDGRAAQQQPGSSGKLGSGLRNATGDFNCFLNVIIQCLWYCSFFRTAVMTWPLQVYQVC